MKLTNLFSMLGGLALFLYGMNMMSNGLEMAAGDKMKTILEKLTSNRILGVLVLFNPHQQRLLWLLVLLILD